MTVLARGGDPPDPPVRGAPPPGAPLPSARAGQPAVAAGTAGVAAKAPRAGAILPSARAGQPAVAAGTAGGSGGSRSRASTVLEALDSVRDPELDEPITSLGFVASCTVTVDGDAQVRLRLPTYFCAPNFAFLMVADAYDVVSALPGVRTAEIVLEDHFASEAINGGVAARAGFARSFDGEAIGELEELRADFLRKAVMAGTDQVCRPLLAAGTDPARLPELTLGGVPPSRALQRLRERRAELGLPAGDGAPLLIDPKTGEPVRPDSLRLHLGRARLTRTSLEANGSICRGMLRHRYDSPGLNSQPRDEEEQ
jgi:metal-sulfur cluster biosynthetic enzyme